MIPVTATSPHGPRRNGATRCPAYKIAPPVPALSAYLSNPGVSCVLASTLMAGLELVRDGALTAEQCGNSDLIWFSRAQAEMWHRSRWERAALQYGLSP
ncbi:MAG: hypothetical protein QOD25_4145 [Alphaproteobacteria bacterium]|jgi:hypothetical protein|nr:hypothetical protein [Alphaproteobacteria bacterium]